WGSCNHRTGRLTFNTGLTHHDPSCLEYVVVHELAHLLVADHGPRFRAILDHHLPDWRHRTRLLNRWPDA
ncbi:MAG: M48 family metallopeptidase, partial [Propionibacteriaceae bacterium]|nr:M48 family metallopeptidase [Propionibacteriaceae bacterium]